MIQTAEFGIQSTINKFYQQECKINFQKHNALSMMNCERRGGKELQVEKNQFTEGGAKLNNITEKERNFFCS